MAKSLFKTSVDKDLVPIWLSMTIVHLHVCDHDSVHLFVCIHQACKVHMIYQEGKFVEISYLLHLL